MIAPQAPTSPAASDDTQGITAADPARAIRIAVLIASEAAALTLAAAAVTRLSGQAPGTLVDPLAATALALIGARGLAGLYPGHGLHPEAILQRGLLAGLVAAMATVIAAVLGHVMLALWVAAFGLIALPAQGLARAGAVRLLLAARLWSVPVHVIAPAPLRQPIEAFLRRNRCYGLDPDGTGVADLALVTDAATASDAQVVARHRQVILLADLPVLRLSGLAPARIGGAIGMRVIRNDTGTRLKRALDLAVAVPMLVLVAPLIALAAACIWVADPGPVFYMQPREGRDGRILRVPKLRSMYRDADAMLRQLLLTDAQAAAEWNSHFKLRDDPRILPGIGRLLRRSSCDELPQLLTVITGGMSLVGPRPFPDYHLAAMSPEFRRKRCSVPPGITGLWQVSERAGADVARQQQLDDFYIDNRTFWLDLSILLRTVPAVVLGRGAC